MTVQATSHQGADGAAAQFSHHVALFICLDDSGAANLLNYCTFRWVLEKVGSSNSECNEIFFAWFVTIAFQLPRTPFQSGIWMLVRGMADPCVPVCMAGSTRCDHPEWLCLLLGLIILSCCCASSHVVEGCAEVEYAWSRSCLWCVILEILYVLRRLFYSLPPCGVLHTSFRWVTRVMCRWMLDLASVSLSLTLSVNINCSFNRMNRMRPNLSKLSTETDVFTFLFY
jgi:hypothetical protein